MSEYGPHLLGRRPSTPDARDFTVAMVKDADPIQIAFQKLLVSRRVAPATKVWATEVMRVMFPSQPAPDPTPPPITPDQNVIWGLNDPVLDQNPSAHCGGFGGCQWGNLEPIDDHYKDADGHALYYEAVAIGGYPGSEDGVESRWVAKALKARARLSTYAFAKSTDEITDWLRSKGPVMVGTDWTDDMFEPDANGYISPTGAVEGGHFYNLCGHLPAEEAYLMLNSWGDSWGSNGQAKIKIADFAKLLVGIDPSIPGDAIVSPELAV